MKRLIEHIQNKPRHAKDENYWSMLDNRRTILVIAWTLMGSSTPQNPGEFFKGLNSDLENNQGQYQETLLK